MIQVQVKLSMSLCCGGGGGGSSSLDASGGGGGGGGEVSRYLVALRFGDRRSWMGEALGGWGRPARPRHLEPAGARGSFVSARL